MKTNVRKWGNSLGIRVPMPLAKELNLTEGVELKMLINNGRLIIEPQTSINYDLDQLLEDINESNLHGETLTGDSIGSEVW